MLARTGPWVRPVTWMRRSVRTGVVAVSGAGSAAGLRWPARGRGPDKSGSSLAYASSCRESLRAGSAGASTSRGGVLAAPGAAVPEMKRLNRASAFGAAAGRPAGLGSRGFGASAGGRRCACEDRAPPRCREGSPASAPAACGGRCAPPRSAAPFPFGLSPGPGYPGSFGEVTPRLLTMHPAAGAVGDRSRVGCGTRIVVGVGGCFSFFGVTCDG